MNVHLVYSLALFIFAIMAKKDKRGGAREGAGRSVVADKVAPVTIYVRESVINKYGKERIKVAALGAINAL